MRVLVSLKVSRTFSITVFSVWRFSALGSAVEENRQTLQTVMENVRDTFDEGLGLLEGVSDVLHHRLQRLAVLLDGRAQGGERVGPGLAGKDLRHVPLTGSGPARDRNEVAADDRERLDEDLAPFQQLHRLVHPDLDVDAALRVELEGLDLSHDDAFEPDVVALLEPLDR